MQAMQDKIKVVIVDDEPRASTSCKMIWQLW